MIECDVIGDEVHEEFYPSAMQAVPKPLQSRVAAEVWIDRVLVDCEGRSAYVLLLEISHRSNILSPPIRIAARYARALLAQAPYSQ
jgi:hypothetical protein